MPLAAVLAEDNASNKTNKPDKDTLDWWNKIKKIGNIQPKIDMFNALNRAPVTSVLGLNYGTAAYMVPSVILNPRTFQVGANVRF